MYQVTVMYHLMDSSWQDVEAVRTALKHLGFSTPTTHTASGLVERTVHGAFTYPSAAEARDDIRWKISTIFGKYDLLGRATVSVSEYVAPLPSCEQDAALAYIVP